MCYGRSSKFWFVSLFAALGMTFTASAAMLTIGTAQGTFGETLVVPVVLDAESGTPPAALAFNIDFGNEPLEVVQVDAGPACAAADKTVSYQTHEHGVRVLVGGINTNFLPNGELVLVGFRLTRSLPQADVLALQGRGGSAASASAVRVALAFFAGALDVDGQELSAWGQGTLLGLFFCVILLSWRYRKSGIVLALLFALLLLTAGNASAQIAAGFGGCGIQPNPASTDSRGIPR